MTHYCPVRIEYASSFEGATENTSLASLSDLNERMETLKQSLNGWAQIQAVDKKKLHRRVVRAVYLRGTQVVAVQPTPEYLPLFQEKSCSCGEGGTFVCEQTNPA